MNPKILLSAALLASATPALAQGTRPAAKAPAAATPPAPTTSDATIQARAEALTTGMVQGLGLNPAQTEKVQAINVASVRNVENARQRYRQNPAKLRSYIDDIGLARLEQLKDVLTSSQFARYQQKREEKMGIPTMHSNQGTPTPGLNTGGPTE